MKNNKSSKSGLKYISVLMALILFATFFVSIPKQTVLAEETELDDTMVIEQGSGVYKIQDEALYDALVAKLRTIKPEETVLTVGSFKNLSIEEFNFSGTGKSDDAKIASLAGLEYIKLPNLKSLILADNNITGSVVGFFNLMQNLEKIDLSNNQVTSFDGSFSTKLTEVNLSNNKITNANIQSLVEGGNVDLSFNSIKSFDEITFPQLTCTISLTHNYIVEDVPSDNVCTLKMGFQGVRDGDDTVKSTQIRLYELDGVENFKLYKKQTDGTYTLYETVLLNSSITNLNIAEYKLEFTETSEDKVYQDIYFVCRPNTPTITPYNTNNKVINNSNSLFNEVVVIKLEAEGEIYYKINNGQTVKGNEITINKRGSYTITYWQNLEGMDSVKTSYLVISRYFAPINIVWIILVVGAITGMFMFGVYYTKVLVYKKSSKQGGSRHRDFD